MNSEDFRITPSPLSSSGEIPYTPIMDGPEVEEELTLSFHRDLEGLLSAALDYDEIRQLHPLIFQMATEHLPLIKRDYTPEDAYEILTKLLVDVNDSDLGIQLDFHDLKEILTKSSVEFWLTYGDSFGEEILSTYRDLFELAEVYIQKEYFLPSLGLTSDSSQSILSHIFIEGMIDVKEDKKIKQEEKLILTHMGCNPKKNDYKTKMDILVQHYKEHPKEAIKQFESCEKALTKLAAAMKHHYSGHNLTLLGRETLNRILLSDPAFAKFLHKPDIIKGIIAMEVIGSKSFHVNKKEAVIKRARDLNQIFVGFQTTMSTVLRFCLQSHPNSLYLIVPNGDKRDVTFLENDKLRRKNLIKMTKAVNGIIPKKIHLAPQLLRASCFDTGYNPKNWSGPLFKEFYTFCTSLKKKPLPQFLKFAETRKDLKGWVTNQGPGECMGGMKLLLKESGLSPPEKFTFKEVVATLAQSTAWLQPDVAHLCLDRLHFGAMMMFSDHPEMILQLGDAQISCADLMLEVASYLNTNGMNETNAIAGEALFSRMALIKDYGIEQLGWYEFTDVDPIIKDIEEKFGPNVAQNYFQMVLTIDGHLKELLVKYGGVDKIIDADDKELYKRLKLMQEQLLSDPTVVIQTIVKYHKDPMFQYMGPFKFVSFLYQSKINLPEEKDAYKLTSRQRVALYGYTTGDFKIINPAMRLAKGGMIEDPGLDAYVHYAKKAMQKLPDYQPENDSIQLKRAIFTEPPSNPNWGKETFIKDKEFQDFAFVSTTITLNSRGLWNLIYTSFIGAKDVGPYSAWPGEKEILIYPEIIFIVDDVDDQKNVVLKPKD